MLRTWPGAFLAADIFAAVCRCNVKISGTVKGRVGRIAVFIELEQIKFAFRTDIAAQIMLCQKLLCIGKKSAAIRRKRCAVRIPDLTE